MRCPVEKVNDLGPKTAQRMICLGPGPHSGKARSPTAKHIADHIGSGCQCPVESAARSDHAHNYHIHTIQRGAKLPSFDVQGTPALSPVGKRLRLACRATPPSARSFNLLDSIWTVCLAKQPITPQGLCNIFSIMTDSTNMDSHCLTASL